MGHSKMSEPYPAEENIHLLGDGILDWSVKLSSQLTLEKPFLCHHVDRKMLISKLPPNFHLTGLGYSCKPTSSFVLWSNCQVPVLRLVFVIWNLWAPKSFEEADRWSLHRGLEWDIRTSSPVYRSEEPSLWGKVDRWMGSQRILGG